MNQLSRRRLLQLALAAAALPRSAAARRTVAPRVAEAVGESFASLPFEAQQLGGLLDARMRTNVEGRLMRVDLTACLAAFAQRDSAGRFDGAWLGEHAGKFLEAACNALRYREHVGLRARVQQVAQALIATQAADGYLGTYPQAQRWGGWDVWVHKYNLIGLLAYYEFSADEAAFGACRAMGDLLVSTFGEEPGQRDIVSAGEHLGMAATCVLEPMCRLYCLTGEQRYLQFCRYLVRAGEHPHGPRLLSTLLSDGGVDRAANGKAYEMLSNFNGLLDLYRLSGEPQLLDAVLRGWEDIVAHQRYASGALSAGEHFQPRGRLLTLQSSNVGETCVTVTWLQLNWRLLRLTGEARFGHEIERAVYNQLLAAQDAASGDYAYYTALTGAKEFTDATLCCVSSGPRAIALLPQLVWGLQGRALFINLYTPGAARFQIDAVPVAVRCATEFPADGRASFSVEVPRPCHFTVRLRVPPWCRDFSARLGTATFVGEPGQLLDVTRLWSGRSTLEVRMDMPTQVLPGVAPYGDYELLQYGPQLLALERALNPQLPYLERVARAAPVAQLRPVTVPSAGRKRRAYELDAQVAVPGDRQLRLEQRVVRLVPFADLRDGRAWLTRPGQLRLEPPAVTAFARASLSVLSLGLEPSAPGAARTDVAEFVTDEDPHSYCTVNPEDFGLDNYLGAPRGRRGDPVWFAVVLPAAARIGRVVFRHGAVSEAGGWFECAESPPRIEVARAPVALSANRAVPDNRAIRWEAIGALEDYPRAGAAEPRAAFTERAFELRLPQPLEVYAVRIVGRAGGEFASCAELAAYGA